MIDVATLTLVDDQRVLCIRILPLVRVLHASITLFFCQRSWVLLTDLVSIGAFSVCLFTAHCRDSGVVALELLT